VWKLAAIIGCTTCSFNNSPFILPSFEVLAENHHAAHVSLEADAASNGGGFAEPLQDWS